MGDTSTCVVYSCWCLKSNDLHCDCELYMYIPFKSYPSPFSLFSKASLLLSSQIKFILFYFNLTKLRGINWFLERCHHHWDPARLGHLIFDGLVFNISSPPICEVHIHAHISYTPKIDSQTSSSSTFLFFHFMLWWLTCFFSA